jgi:uncharacterized RDD family membrane protein YckC
MGQPAGPSPEPQNAAILDADASVTNATVEIAVMEPETKALDGNGDASGDIVSQGKDVVVEEGQVVQEVVVLNGSADIRGKVRGGVVVVGGNLKISGTVKHKAVAVLGSITLAPGASVQGDVVSVGGTIEKSPDATVSGSLVQPFPCGIPDFRMEGLEKKLPPVLEWGREGVLKMRMLPPGIGWCWWLFLGFLALYLLAALVLRRPVMACVSELEGRPASTFLTGLLVMILLPMVLGLLTISIVGWVVIPLLLLAGVLAAVLGKTAMLVCMGRFFGRITRQNWALLPPVAALFGGLVFLLLYLVPILGAVVFLLTGVWAIGVGTLALFSSSRSESRLRKPPVPPTAFAPDAPAPTSPAAAGLQSQPKTGANPSAMLRSQPGLQPAVSTSVLAPDVAPNPGVPPVVPSLSPVLPPAPLVGGTSLLADPIPPTFQQTPPVVPSALAATPFQAPTPGPAGTLEAAGMTEADALPRAGFGSRVVAGLVDFALVIVLDRLLVFLMHRFADGPFLFLLVALAYFAGMWAWKGTTVGGIVMNLRVVRLDGQPVSFGVALVRALGGAFSVIMLFLGFLWAAWDKEHQGWHDMIAGTVVVAAPRRTSLI